MTYLDEANLSADPEFQRRLAAAVAHEAKPKTSNFANQILASPQEGARKFMPFVASEPGFGDDYSSGGQAAIVDGEMLAAIQANWDRVETVYSPVPTEPV